MERLTEFEVKFSGLKEGVHKFDFSVTDKFFEEFEYKEFNSIQATVELNLHKKATLMEAHYSMQGQVNLNCDLTNEPFDMKVAHQFDLVIKFGPDFSDDHEDLMVLPHGAHTYDASQHIYELLVLSIPQKRVHPGVEDGTLDSDILERLEQLSPSEDKPSQNGTDPRWDALKKLKE